LEPLFRWYFSQRSLYDKYVRKVDGYLIIRGARILTFILGKWRAGVRYFFGGAFFFIRRLDCIVPTVMLASGGKFRKRHKVALEGKWRCNYMAITRKLHMQLPV
jgi:hypothetical protein